MELELEFDPDDPHLDLKVGLLYLLNSSGSRIACARGDAVLSVTKYHFIAMCFPVWQVYPTVNSQCHSVQLN